jgi:hypothetical protein
MDELAAFLLARIAEREELARRMDADGWSPGTAVDTFGARDTDELVAAYWDQVGDPAHVLAECEAKREIIGQQRAWEANGGPDAFRTRAALSQVLRLLALPDADHPDYQEAWKP